jgi:hypothetical protein
VGVGGAFGGTGGGAVGGTTGASGGSVGAVGGSTMYTAKDAVITGSVTQCTGTQPVTLPQDVSVPSCQVPGCVHAACITGDQVHQYAPNIQQATLNLEAYCPNAPNAYCTPGDYIATGGQFLFKKCTSLLNLEGRCVSTCIPQIYNQQTYLPKADCADGELCAPCFDPRFPAGQDTTDACKQACDPGPAAGSPTTKFDSCGNGLGQCVPSTLVPKEFQYVVPKDTCTQDGYVCAPVEKVKDIHTNFVQCTPSNATTASAAPGPNGEKGGCVPKYLIDDYNVPGVTAIPTGFVNQDSCQAGYLCAPCNNPLAPANAPDKAFTGACPDPNLPPALKAAGG